MKRFFLLLMMPALLLGGCYYDEGPVISLRTPENRLVNKWEYQKFRMNGQDITDTYRNSWVEFKSDKSATFFEDTSYTYYATWEFSDDFKTLYLDCIDDSGNVWSQDYYILKLRDKELWMESDLGSVTNYVELVEF